MKYLQGLGTFRVDAAPTMSQPFLEVQLRALEHRPAGSAAVSGERRLQAAELLHQLGRAEEAVRAARTALGCLVENGAWEDAVRACRLVYLAGGRDSVDALAQGIWLAVTYPVDPELTVAMLQHLIDAVPGDADGAAVAAAAAVLVVGLRGSDEPDDPLAVYTGQMLVSVARQHSNVQDQSELDRWVRHLELDDVGYLLPRLRSMIDALVPGTWWFDVEALRRDLGEPR